jgi:hypothetical protein
VASTGPVSRARTCTACPFPRTSKRARVASGNNVRVVKEVGPEPRPVDTPRELQDGLDAEPDLAKQSTPFPRCTTARGRRTSPTPCERKPKPGEPPRPRSPRGELPAPKGAENHRFCILTFMEAPDDRPAESLHAIALLNRFRPILLAEAASVLATRPDAEIAGLVAERGCQEWKRIRVRIAEDTGIETTAPLFVGLVHRHVVEEVLGRQDGAGPFLVDAKYAPDSLLVACVTKHGVQGVLERIPGRG